MRTTTACTMDCPDACSLVVETEADGTVRITGNPDHPVTAGFICAKIRRFGQTLRSPNRITTPLRRVGDGWQPIDWPAALEICAEKIDQYRQEPSSILHIFDVGSKGLLSLVSILFFARLGASRAAGSLCDTAGIAACIADFGALTHNDIQDMVNARWIVNWGKDLSRSSVHAAALVREARQRGAQVLTISPGGDGNGGFSDRLVRVRPGTDRFLAAAVIRLLWERGRIEPGILDHTHDWPAFQTLVMSRSLADLSAACEVAVADIEAVFDFYGQAEPVATLMGYGLQRYQYGGENVRFVNALALLSGNIGRSGGGSYFNLPSARNFNLDWMKDPGEEQRRTLRLPTIGQDILTAKDPPIKMIWVNGCNVVNQCPDSRTVAQAFAATEFKVVVDAFMNDTAERADLVLPCALMLEREEIIGSFMHDYVNYAGLAVAPPESARTDHWILSELGKQLHPPVLLPDAEACLKASLDSPYLDVTLEELRRKGFVHARRPQVIFADLHFAHPDGRYRFPDGLHDEVVSPDGFPLHLLTLVRREAIHSQILPEEHASLPTVWVAPDSPALQSIDLNGDVYLASPLGRLKVAVETLPGLHPGTCIYRRGDWMKLGGGANQLIAAGLTDMGDGTPFYSQYVRLEN